MDDSKTGNDSEVTRLTQILREITASSSAAKVAADDKIGTLTAQSVKDKAEIGRNQTKIAALEKQIATLEKQGTELKSQIEMSKKELSAMNSKNDELEKQLQVAIAAKNALEGPLKAYR